MGIRLALNQGYLSEPKLNSCSRATKTIRVRLSSLRRCGLMMDAPTPTSAAISSDISLTDEANEARISAMAVVAAEATSVVNVSVPSRSARSSSLNRRSTRVLPAISSARQRARVKGASLSRRIFSARCDRSCSKSMSVSRPRRRGFKASAYRETYLDSDERPTRSPTAAKRSTASVRLIKLSGMPNVLNSVTST